MSEQYNGFTHNFIYSLEKAIEILYNHSSNLNQEVTKETIELVLTNMENNKVFTISATDLKYDFNIGTEKIHEFLIKINKNSFLYYERRYIINKNNDII